MLNLRRSEDGWRELDIYLTEKTELRAVNSLGFSYDVLEWWKSNAYKFPVLYELARDILAIQMSSVASESCFSTSECVLDPYRSSLTPYMVEVLVCLQQWLRSGYKDVERVANMTQMLEEAEFFENLDARNQMSSTQTSQLIKQNQKVHRLFHHLILGQFVVCLKGSSAQPSPTLL